MSGRIGLWAAGCALALLAGPAAGLTVHYDGSVTPDHTSLQSVFSTQLAGSGAWSAGGGVLTISTVAAVGSTAWFGNHATHDPVPWALSGSDPGNSLTIRTCLGPDSGEWFAYILDGDYRASIQLDPGQVSVAIDGGEWVTRSLDTGAYHEYRFDLIYGMVRYKADGDVLYAGMADTSGSQKYLVVGDGSFTAPTGYGTMLVDDLVVETESPAPHPGDADWDGAVNYLDLGILATCYGQAGQRWGQGDFTHDGLVNYIDLGIVATYYGWEAGLSRAGPSAGAPVPEPAALSLLALAALALRRRRPR